jgi:Flp pilus assembly protein TadG
MDQQTRVYGSTKQNRSTDDTDFTDDIVNPKKNLCNLWIKRLRALRRDEGQVLIQTTIMLLVLLGFVALAVDVGHVYGERRRLQNAADAGALAGAYELCRLSPADVARARAIEYMERNGVPADEIAEDDVVIEGNVVNVTAQETTDTFLAGFAGFPTLDVGATAAAACGAATSACGLWPLAFERGFWDENLECGEQFVVWDAEKENPKEESVCMIGGEARPLCDCYICDLDSDGEDDFRLVTETSRGWLDYSSNLDDPFVDTCQAEGCGAAELRCRIQSDSAARVTVPSCIPGIRGIKAGVKAAVEARAGQPISIALYDGTNCPADSNCSGTEADTFFVTSFGCVTVDGWVQNFELQPRPEFPTLKKIKSKAIVVSRRCDGACMTNCGSTDGENPEPWQVTAASLIR